jgi:hypothetical protein
LSKQTLLPPGIAINDPRPIAAEAPYSFYLPLQQEIDAIEPQDMVQAIFRETTGDRQYAAERMWMTVETVGDGFVAGRLCNTPTDMPSLKLDDYLCIPLTHIISVAFREGKPKLDMVGPRSYWDRCFVDACVVEGRSHVDYFYREEPDMTREGDKDPDSGWRIRGTEAAIAEDERLSRNPMYIALGKVLNEDDRWIHLIDSEIGSAFQWDAERDDYIAIDWEQPSATDQ